MSGMTSYLAGRTAEDRVAAEYARAGHVILSRRWRGQAGEIDLVAEKDGETVFIEVKKSRSFARAAERLSRRQMQRIYASASDYLGHLPDGQNSVARFDVALVNDRGIIEIVENALCA
ncbi:YraN family protein [Rhodophyticola porphyridii]|uniref:UPF0102 protein D9R08_02485 n=1 Tax=Rhodophyticola porphyridii TaxID=1852017 RepID=A0A3L9Y5X7_9RHOB|nr:YraN family protein [Rhodophyticola porphyridii]RMA43812.1 hypothetical protein D9R08_02485 [Rhodophyticola porphyridii]